MRYTAKAELDTRKKNNPLWVRFDYLYKNAHNFSAGKDIRLYGAGDWFLLILAQLTATYTKVIGKYTRQVFTFSAGRALLSMLREAVAYIYLIGSVLAGTSGCFRLYLLFRHCHRICGMDSRHHTAASKS